MTDVPDLPPEAMPRGTMVLHWEDMKRMVTAAANDAARQVAKEAHITKGDVEQTVDLCIERFCERLGLPTEKKEIDEWRKDLSAMRAARELREALYKHGLMAVITVFMTGICTAIWLALKGAR